MRGAPQKKIDTVPAAFERQPDGKWIKDIKFKIPMINNETLFGLDNLNQLETVALLSQQNQMII